MRMLAGLMTVAAALSACDSAPEPLSVERAWVRLGAVQGRPAAAYFTIRGGPAPVTLINVSTDVAIQAEMHETVARGMRPIARVAIPAGAVVPFAPGGRHVMLFDMNAGIKPGRTIDLTLSFADGTRLLKKATVIAAGDPAPQ